MMGEDKIDETHRHHAERDRWPDEHEIDKGESPDEGEENAEPDRESCAQSAVAEMRRKHMRCGSLLNVHGRHRRHAADRHINENRPCDIETSKDKEVARQSK